MIQKLVSGNANNGTNASLANFNYRNSVSNSNQNIS